MLEDRLGTKVHPTLHCVLSVVILSEVGLGLRFLLSCSVRPRMPALAVPPREILAVVDQLIAAKRAHEVSSLIKGFLWRGPDIL